MRTMHLQVQLLVRNPTEQSRCVSQACIICPAYMSANRGDVSAHALQALGILSQILSQIPSCWRWRETPTKGRANTLPTCPLLWENRYAEADGNL